VSGNRNALILVASLVALAGCGGESGTGPPGPPPEPPLVNAPADVIESLRVAWDGRNPDMADFLADDFMFYFPPFDVEFWGAPESWDVQEELICAQNIFAGDPGQRPGGVYQAPVDVQLGSFGIVLTPVDSDWAVTQRTDAPFAGLLARRYDVLMFAQYTSSDFDFVGSRSEFFLAEETFTQNDGSEARRYVLKRWRDLGNPNPALRHGTISWGFFKWIYR
jgi:hypothetical protein